MFANLVASLEMCATAVELWEIWRERLRDENSKQLVQRMIVILSRYLGYPEGRAFSLYQQKGKRVFLEMVEKIRDVRADLEAISITERDLTKLEKIEGRLNQLARNFRLEIERLAKAEAIEYGM